MRGHGKKLKKFWRQRKGSESVARKGGSQKNGLGRNGPRKGNRSSIKSGSSQKLRLVKGLFTIEGARPLMRLHSKTTQPAVRASNPFVGFVRVILPRGRIRHIPNRTYAKWSVAAGKMGISIVEYVERRLRKSEEGH